MKVLFIPYAEGIYVPFNLHQYTARELEDIVKKGKTELDTDIFKHTEVAIRPTFFLDLDSLSQVYKQILL